MAVAFLEFRLCRRVFVRRLPVAGNQRLICPSTWARHLPSFVRSSVLTFRTSCNVCNILVQNENVPWTVKFRYAATLDIMGKMVK